VTLALDIYLQSAWMILSSAKNSPNTTATGNKSGRRLAPFVLLQLSSLTSIVSGSMVFITFPWLALDLTGLASSAGLLVAITNIPGLLLSPVIGSIIDKFGRRRSSVWVEWLTAGSALIVPTVAALLTMNLPLLIAVGVLRSIVGSGGGTARKSLVPDVADAGQIPLTRANSIHEAVFASGFAIGPAIAAISIAQLGAINTFYVVGAASVLSAIFSMLIRVTEKREEHDPADSGNIFVFASQGFRALVKTPAVFMVMGGFSILALIYIPIEVVLLPAHFNELKDPESLGVIISTMAAFSVLGALGFERLHKFISYANLLRMGILGVAISIFPMSALPPIWVMLFFGAILGFVWGPLAPLLNTVIQERVSPNMRGRVFSLEMTIWTAGPMISMPLVGALVDAWGVQPVYLTLAILVMAAGIFISTRRQIHELDAPLPDGKED
jgi:MFS family permease